MMQKRVLGVYFSIMRRSAICAVEVMASASSRIMSLYVARVVEEDALSDESAAVVGVKELKICLVEENVCRA